MERERRGGASPQYFDHYFNRRCLSVVASVVSYVPLSQSQWRLFLIQRLLFADLRPRARRRWHEPSESRGVASVATSAELRR